MSEQHYATPEANLTEGVGDLAEIIAPLSATRSWVKLCSVLGFISTGFIALAAIGMLLSGSLMSGVDGGESAGMAVASFGLLGALYLLMAVLYFVPSLFLFKYSTAISNAEQTHSAADVAHALTMQKSFWKFVGIAALILVVIMILSIVAAVLVPTMMI